MKILSVAVIASSIFAVIGASNVRADGPVYFKPEIAYVLPTDGDVDDSVFLGGRVGYEMDPNWALEIESGWMELGWDPTENITNIDVTVVPLLLNVRWGQRCSPEELGWYGFVGAGWAFNSLDSDADLQIDDTFTWQAGFGAEMNVSQGLDAFLDIRYMWNKGDIQGPAGIDPNLNDNLELSSVLFTTGVRF